MVKERIEERVSRLGTKLADDLGYELVDVEYRKEGPDWVLRCFIDCPGGTGLEQCQIYSEQLSNLLDEADPIPGSYLLEVSSPGLERPLKKERDFQRFAGHQVALKLHQAYEGAKNFQGELLGIKTEPETMILIKLNGETKEIPHKLLAKAELIPEIFAGEGRKVKK